MSAQPRPIDEVITAILNIVPHNFERRGTLAEELRAVVKDSYYTAPEAMSMRWEQVSMILRRNIPTVLRAPWVTLVQNVFCAETDYKEFL